MLAGSSSQPSEAFKTTLQSRGEAVSQALTAFSLGIDAREQDREIAVTESGGALEPDPVEGSTPGQGSWAASFSSRGPSLSLPAGLRRGSTRRLRRKRVPGE